MEASRNNLNKDLISSKSVKFDQNLEPNNVKQLRMPNSPRDIRGIQTYFNFVKPKARKRPLKGAFIEHYPVRQQK